MGDELAILGGTPVLSGPLPSYNSIGAEEVKAVTRVMESGCLSGFYGSWSDPGLLDFAVRGNDGEYTWRSDRGNPQEDYGFELFRQAVLMLPEPPEDTGLIRRSFLFEEVYERIRHLMIATTSASGETDVTASFAR